MSQTHVSSVYEYYPSAAFRAQSLDIWCGVEFVVLAIDCVCSHGLCHRLFIDETEAEFPYVPYGTAGRRSSSGRLLMFTSEQKLICTQRVKPTVNR
jgi:hypothetical protein